MSNVTTFPSSQRMPGGWIVHGGRAYRNIAHVMKSVSHREWRRLVQWEARHAAQLPGDEVKQA